MIDVCQLFVVGLRLGLPGETDDLFEKLGGAGIISDSLRETLKRIKAFRNNLVHEYGAVDDEIVYRAATSEAADFERFRDEILAALKTQ